MMVEYVCELVCDCVEMTWYLLVLFFFFQAEDGIRDRSVSRGLGDVYKRQDYSGIYLTNSKGLSLGVQYKFQGLPDGYTSCCHP